MRSAPAALTLILLTVPSLALVVRGGQARGSRETKLFRILRATVPDAIAGVEATEIRAQWESGTNRSLAMTGPRTSAARVIRRRGGLPRDRQPELALDRVVVTLVDSDGRDLFWRIVPNPRRIRAEVPGPDGLLSGRVLERDDTEIFVAAPDHPRAVRLNIYEPVWNGTEFLLEIAASIDLASRQ